MLELRAVNNLQRHCQIQTTHQNTAEPRDQPKELEKSKRTAKNQPRRAESKKQRSSKNSATAPNQPNV